MSAMSDYIPISEYLAAEIGTQSGLSGKSRILTSNPDNGIALAAETGGSTCSGCETSCSGGCKGTCSGTCSGSCRGTCSGSCKSGCYGSCKSTCTGTCVGDCTGNCAGTCTGGCETYCADYCQTYCQYDQTYSTNDGPNNPGGNVFTWSTTIAAGETIIIKASDWNQLASYVEDAAPYCYGSSISLSRASAPDPITAVIFNNLDGGIGKINVSVGTKYADIDLIKASEIQALADNYNEASMISTLPPTDGLTSGKCCQIGESCMTQASGRPSLQPCLKGQVCPQTALH